MTTHNVRFLEKKKKKKKQEKKIAVLFWLKKEPYLELELRMKYDKIIVQIKWTIL